MNPDAHVVVADGHEAKRQERQAARIAEFLMAKGPASRGLWNGYLKRGIKPEEFARLMALVDAYHDPLPADGSDS